MGKRFPLVSGVVVHLAAAGLCGAKLHLMAQALQYCNHSLPRSRK